MGIGVAGQCFALPARISDASMLATFTCAICIEILYIHNVWYDGIHKHEDVISITQN